MSDLKRASALAFTAACKAEDFQAAEIHVGHAMDELYRLYELAKKSPSRADKAARGSSNNGTASGDSGLKNARLPLLDVRTSKRVLAAIRILPALKATEQRGLRCCVTLPETTAR